MIAFTLVVLFISYSHIDSQSWNTSDGILPWESYIKLIDIQQPLGLTLNRSSLAHHHFAIGYLCLHTFMYDEAQDAFNLALNVTPTFIEPYIGKILACKHVIWSETDFNCGLAAYNSAQSMLNTSNITLSPLQSSLLSTAYLWYSNVSSVAAGELAFSSSIGNLSQAYPNVTDITVLWGLSLLNVAYQDQFDGVMEPAPMLQSRDVLATALKNEPNHPGALLYMILAYDVAESSIASKAVDYVSSYQNLSSTLSYAIFIPAHIWMRIGSYASAKSSDFSSLQASLSLCLIKIMGRNMTIASSELNSVLAQLNTTDQVQAFLQCDTRNRGTATEWLASSFLQTGDWNDTISSITDLYLAYNESLPISSLYLSYAYRTRARAVINIFYWLPYDIQFIDMANEVQQLHDTLDSFTSNTNMTDEDLAWSEAGYRLSSCFRILTNINATYSDPTIQPTIDEHLARFAVLSNETASLNPYISVSISLMINQVYGIIYYQNNSFRDCLSILDAATQREFSLVIDNNSPILIYARSSELLAMHLLLIQRVAYGNLSATAIANLPTFTLNGTQVSVSQFSQYALNLYQIANLSSPNRAINILGAARANSQLLLNNVAAGYYQMLLDQISSQNASDPVFFQEAINFIAQNQVLQSSANNNHLNFFINLISFCILIFY
ncbi:unnamed protein product [Adineta steineri]|uniref:Uncharacterized protein n=1 Tax=Adineta steineri TaxID=433720 RepID=A0A818RG16_9BILA|nr:unnamed protein product [Adineta steineri]CAF3657026.1 unnamed protein product [Adineta steineri]